MAVPRPNRRTGSHASCAICAATFWKFASTPDRKHCSKACGDLSRRRYEREMRSCKSCSASFEHIPKPFSNSRGTYCSIKCRNNGYAATAVRYGHRGARARWSSARRKFIAAGNDFCTRCGIKDCRLEVHHIEPYRVLKNNAADNLMTLCHPCHAKLEPLSNKIAALPDRARESAVAIVQAHFGDFWHIHKGRQLGF